MVVGRLSSVMLFLFAVIAALDSVASTDVAAAPHHFIAKIQRLIQALPSNASWDRADAFRAELEALQSDARNLEDGTKPLDEAVLKLHADHESETLRMPGDIDAQEQTINQLLADVTAKDQVIANLTTLKQENKAKITELETLVAELRGQVQVYEGETGRLQSQVAERDRSIDGLRTDMSNLKAEGKATVANQTARITQLEAQAQNDAAVIKQGECIASDLRAQIQSLEGLRRNDAATITNLRSDMADRDGEARTTIADLSAKLDTANQRLSDTRHAADLVAGQFRALQESNAETRRALNDTKRSWVPTIKGAVGGALVAGLGVSKLMSTPTIPGSGKKVEGSSNDATPSKKTIGLVTASLAIGGGMGALAVHRTIAKKGGVIPSSGGVPEASSKRSPQTASWIGNVLPFVLLVLVVLAGVATTVALRAKTKANADKTSSSGTAPAIVLAARRPSAIEY
ncbi:Uncharacterized protein PBTT_05848 [Plasmodiophora brassicae]|uniref:Uncharacterized protein n=1 Tax=Plasmodiophora brassicae TaxID=37360 RepID=A0A0G4J3B8_PLABS|nr:hypothetical protein PBRA_002297 [Plasmodiophora brassicae]SPQ98884.1 unnamed protein product [Plasmodiophora brassicae]